MKQFRQIIIVAMVLVFSQTAHANYTGIIDFDWPTYWDEHKDDQNVVCGHVALAAALYYWDQRYPNLIPDSYGIPETIDFTAEDGNTYKVTSFWKLMNDLTGYIGCGDVFPDEFETGIPKWFKDHSVGLSFHTTKGMKYTEEWAFLKSMIDKGEVSLIQIKVIDPVNGDYVHWITGVGYNDDASLSVMDPNVIGQNTQKYDVTKKDDGWYIKYYDGNQARIQSIQAVTATPEPASMILFSLGLLGAGALKRFRGKKSL